MNKKVSQWVEGPCVVFWSVFTLWTRYFGKVLQWACFVLFCAVGVLLELWCTIEECAIVVWFVVHIGGIGLWYRCVVRWDLAVCRAAGSVMDKVWTGDRRDGHRQ